MENKDTEKHTPYKKEKTYDQHREHFIERLDERYRIRISENEYDILCSREYVQCCYKGKFTKGPKRSIGLLDIQGTEVLVNYYSYLFCFTTALPIDNVKTPQGLIQTCFAGSVRHLANYVLERILEELNTARKDFSSNKEMAMYYLENHLFAPLLIDQYKYGVLDNFKIMRQIRNILTGKSQYVEICLKKINADKDLSIQELLTVDKEEN